VHPRHAPMPAPTLVLRACALLNAEPCCEARRRGAAGGLLPPDRHGREPAAVQAAAIRLERPHLLDCSSRVVGWVHSAFALTDSPCISCHWIPADAAPMQHCTAAVGKGSTFEHWPSKQHPASNILADGAYPLNIASLQQGFSHLWLKRVCAMGPCFKLPDVSPADERH
jgi:hypothetical protein